MICTHYKLHLKSLKGEMSSGQREKVDSVFRSRLSELVVLKLRGDSHTVPKVARDAHDGAGCSRGERSSSDEEEGEGGEEEEDEDGSDAEDEEESDADDSSGNGSDSAENKDAVDGSESDDAHDAPEVGVTYPTSSCTVALYLCFQGRPY